MRSSRSIEAGALGPLGGEEEGFRRCADLVRHPIRCRPRQSRAIPPPKVGSRSASRESASTALRTRLITTSAAPTVTGNRRDDTLPRPRSARPVPVPHPAIQRLRHLNHFASQRVEVHLPARSSDAPTAQTAGPAAAPPPRRPPPARYLDLRPTRSRPPLQVAGPPETTARRLLGSGPRRGHLARRPQRRPSTSFSCAACSSASARAPGRTAAFSSAGSSA
jgi:hypothetical protein